MDAVQQYEQRLAAYRRLKPAIEQGYAKGSFVAIADDRVIASARSFREIQESIRSQGGDPRQVLVVQAGMDLPDYVTIFV